MVMFFKEIRIRILVWVYSSKGYQSSSCNRMTS